MDYGYMGIFVSSATFGDDFESFWSSAYIDNASMQNRASDKFQLGGADMFVKIKPGKKMEQIPAALDIWIERKQHCETGVSIKSLSRQIGINSSYLSTYFNGVLGTNFQQWLHNLRIEEAKKIIQQNPNVKIADVALAVGIPILYNFSRWFSKISGMTANAWRKKCRELREEDVTCLNQ